VERQRGVQLAVDLGHQRRRRERLGAVERREPQ
jgi:hypothetical protein